MAAVAICPENTDPFPSSVFITATQPQDNFPSVAWGIWGLCMNCGQKKEVHCNSFWRKLIVHFAVISPMGGYEMLLRGLQGFWWKELKSVDE